VNGGGTPRTSRPPREAQDEHHRTDRRRSDTAERGVQLINVTTQHCLAATGGAGSAVVATTCDATDKSQYWIDKS
jgi:hypothetical protein